MRIGITCYPTYGGSGVVATELGIELAERGHDVHFITYQPPFRLSGRGASTHYHPVAVSQYPLFEFPPYDLALATRMAEVAEHSRLDLLHVHYAIPHSVSALLARQMLATRGLRLPFVTTLHGTDITIVGKDPAYLPVTKYGIEQSDGVTAISEDLKRRTVDVFGVTRDIEVIANFVNCTLYSRSNAAPRTQFARNGEALLVHMSNFRKVKRPLDVVRVFARVAVELPARLLMVGDGPLREDCERLAAQLGVGDRVDFLGKQERVEGILAACDLMLMPSEMESFGLVALEAMACETPVIATRVGGVPEVITSGEDGMLFAVGDVEGMSQAALSLLRDRDALSAMGEAARNTATLRYCASKIIPQYEAYYRRVIEQ